MDRDAFYKRVAAILQQTPDDFSRDGGRLPEDPDSVVLLDIMALVHDAYGVTLSPETLKSAASADALLRLIDAERASS